MSSVPASRPDLNSFRDGMSALSFLCLESLESLSFFRAVAAAGAVADGEVGSPAVPAPALASTTTSAPPAAASNPPVDADAPSAVDAPASPPLAPAAAAISVWQ